MKSLQPSGIGIVVDKSKATKTFPMKTTVFPRECRLNHRHHPAPQDLDDSFGKWVALALCIIYITLGCMIL